MAKTNSFLSPISILLLVIVIAAIGTWLLPAGQYNKLTANKQESFVMTTPAGNVALPYSQKTLDSLHLIIPLEKFTNGDIRKPVSIPDTFQKQERNQQGPLEILFAPIKGICESIDIILFILFIGGFMFVFNETGAMMKGVSYLSNSMRGREPWLIIILTFMFSFFAASYGMAEEALVFYPLIVPVFLAAGYDLLVPLAIIFGGTMIGSVCSFSNPFSIIIASNAAGINWMDGLFERLILFVILTSLLTWYILRYAAKVKKDSTASLVYKNDGDVKPTFNTKINQADFTQKLDAKTKLLLFIYIASFITMICGVVFLGWWTLEMSALFLGATILIAVVARMDEKTVTTEFIKGAESLLSVAFIVGIARGVTVVLNEGHISDSILYYSANIVQGMPPALFIILLMLFYIVFSLFIQSSSGMAVLTMPIIGALAIIVNIPGREIVNSYMIGMGIMSFVAPTGMILPSLALVNVSFKTWLKFITPLLFVLIIVGSAFLIIGIYS